MHIFNEEYGELAKLHDCKVRLKVSDITLIIETRVRACKVVRCRIGEGSFPLFWAFFVGVYLQRY